MCMPSYHSNVHTCTCIWSHFKMNHTACYYIWSLSVIGIITFFLQSVICYAAITSYFHIVILYISSNFHVLAIHCNIQSELEGTKEILNYSLSLFVFGKHPNLSTAKINNQTSSSAAQEPWPLCSMFILVIQFV